MEGLLVPMITLASQVAQLVNSELAMKTVYDLQNYRMQLLEETKKGYWSDDSKVEDLTSKIQITLETLSNEFKVYQGAVAAVASAPAILPK